MPDHCVISQILDLISSAQNGRVADVLAVDRLALASEEKANGAARLCVSAERGRLRFRAVRGPERSPIAYPARPLED